MLCKRATVNQNWSFPCLPHLIGAATHLLQGRGEAPPAASQLSSLSPSLPDPMYTSPPSLLLPKLVSCRIALLQGLLPVRPLCPHWRNWWQVGEPVDWSSPSKPTGSIGHHRTGHHCWFVSIEAMQLKATTWNPEFEYKDYCN